ncbi:hypothetical protein [Streptomyces sp. NPDC059452]|uniref:hypothetical protein n=1 Tax=Streptomyces sp. NPDC059452 TaxID=3346835 RepID=UPI0036893C6D
MPDRRRRTAFRLPLPARAALLTRERQSSSPDSSPGSSPAPGSPDSSAPSSSPDAPAKAADDNPFAAPPADRPDQPWQPRHPSNSDPDSGSGSGSSGSSGSSGEGSGGRSSWGSQWSNKQPGRGNGGFGGRSGSNGPGGKGGPDGGPAGPRWDPTDPSQRRARYALLGGMWSVFFALFEFSEIALLLGSLSVYWAISALRAEPRSPSGTDRTAVGGTATGSGGASPVTAGSGSGSAAQNGSRPQTTAAISGLVTALLALIIVITTFTVQLVYRDYYTCVNDALTKVGTVACNEELPKPLQPFFGVKE